MQPSEPISLRADASSQARRAADASQGRAALEHAHDRDNSLCPAPLLLLWPALARAAELPPTPTRCRRSTPTAGPTPRPPQRSTPTRWPQKLVTYYRLLAPGAATAQEIAAFVRPAPTGRRRRLLERRRQEAIAADPDDAAVLAQCDQRQGDPARRTAALRRRAGQCRAQRPGGRRGSPRLDHRLCRRPGRLPAALARGADAGRPMGAVPDPGLERSGRRGAAVQAGSMPPHRASPRHASRCNATTPPPPRCSPPCSHARQRGHRRPRLDAGPGTLAAPRRTHAGRGGAVAGATASRRSRPPRRPPCPASGRSATAWPADCCRMAMPPTPTRWSTTRPDRTPPDARRRLPRRLHRACACCTTRPRRPPLPGARRRLDRRDHPGPGVVLAGPRRRRQPVRTRAPPTPGPQPGRRRSTASLPPLRWATTPPPSPPASTRCATRRHARRRPSA